VDLFGDIEAGDHFMVSEETLKWFRSEIFWPGETVDRDPYENWTSAGRRTAWDRAREAVKTILESHTPVFPDESAAAQIRTMLNEDLRSLGAHGVRFPGIE
jgi:trimethylamine:corrinoid methyltransferase-like protein